MTDNTLPAPFSSPQHELEHLRRRLFLGKKIDELIEECMVGQKCLAVTVEGVFDLVTHELEPNAIILRALDEDLSLATFTRGISQDQLAELEPEILATVTHARAHAGGLEWFSMGLDMAGENVGVFAAAWKKPPETNPELLLELMSSVIEELDNYFYAIKANRFKHMTILEIQRCLKSKNLTEAIDRAINILGDAVPISDFLLLYLDEDLEGRTTAQYLVYRNCSKVFDSQEKPMPELEALIREGKQIVVPGNRDLERIIEVQGSTETVLLDGLLVETLVGKVLVKPPAGIGLSVSSREIIQVFAEALRQRLVDFNREKNLLCQYFSPEVTRRLLQTPDYKSRFLSPRKADIGILFADISGFTKLSEQVLRDPERIARFIDHWASGAVECLFSFGGSLDKLVGDCVIGLFGPPFYQGEPANMGLNAFKAAVAIRDFTTRFLNDAENADVQAFSFFPDFGVAIGVNLCSADVGMIGPNKDLTAFSSGMNNTARLQGVAHSNEILLTPSVKESTEKLEPGKWLFSGPHAAQVKNVRDPLPYFKLESGSSS